MVASSYLDGLHAPVSTEATVSDLEVVGSLPPELEGMYLVDSPNPRFEPAGKYHWFDGDGMVHSVQLQGGKATYRNRYVRTAGFLAEEAADKPLWPGLLEPIRADLPGGPDKNTGNTDLVFHGGKLLALWWLGGEPYHLTVPDLDTVGPVDFGGKLTCGVSAHPKVCPRTGELMFFDYSPYRAPYLSYGVVSADGELTHQVDIDVPGPRLFHDIAISENYTVLLDLPMLWRGDAMKAGKRRVDFDPSMPARFGVLKRHGAPESVRWFEAPSCYVYHTINAYEEGSELVMTACRIDNPLPRLPPEQDPGVPRLYFLRLEPYLHEWRFDLETGKVSERRLDDVMTEFPRMNDAFLGRKSRYAYNPRIAPEAELLFEGVVKYDLDADSSETHSFGPGRFGDEAVFVARPGATAEDDGWLISTVHDRNSGCNELEIWDADNMAADPVARVKIPRPFPMGFHACWVPGPQQ